MKINFNKDNIAKFIKIALCGGSVLIVLVASSQIYKAFGNKKEDKYPQLKQINILDEKQNTELTIDGLTYLAPDGYTLEIINGNIHAVKRYYIIDKAKQIVGDDGQVTYYTPSDYILADDMIYREIVVYDEPIIVNNKSL